MTSSSVGEVCQQAPFNRLGAFRRIDFAKIPSQVIRWLSDALHYGWHDFEKNEEGVKCWSNAEAERAESGDCEKFTVQPPASCGAGVTH